MRKMALLLTSYQVSSGGADEPFLDTFYVRARVILCDLIGSSLIIHLPGAGELRLFDQGANIGTQCIRSAFL